MRLQAIIPWQEQFSYRQFSSKDAPSTGKLMDTTLLKAITRVKLRVGDRLKINSAYRTRRHNSHVGGSDQSLHMQGKACDIQAISNERKYEIVKAAMEEDIPRIGIAERFIHLDIGNGRKGQKPRIWLY